MKRSKSRKKPSSSNRSKKPKDDSPLPSTSSAPSSKSKKGLNSEINFVTSTMSDSIHFPPTKFGTQLPYDIIPRDLRNFFEILNFDRNIIFLTLGKILRKYSRGHVYIRQHS